MNIFFEIHEGLPREAPGDDQSTLQALAFLKGLPPQPLILDIGCGPGAQTLALARQSAGKLVAVDIHTPFLTHLKQQTRNLGIEDRIQVIHASMFDLPFRSGSFDCIWSEGAIYIIGLERGLREWKPLLKPGGWLALTELTWLVPDPPPEAAAYWSVEYPGMGSINQNLDIIGSAGYREAAHFSLPIASWWNEYYLPMEKRLASLQQKYPDSQEAAFGLSATRAEIEMYRKYSDTYGYVFYLLQAA